MESISPISFPDEGNDVSRQVEDDSYWFQHRNDCIQEVLRQFPPAGTVFDIGGGNGYVAAGLQRAGYDVAVVEPGPGARHALERGVQKVIWGTMEDAAFESQSLPAASAFDVIEHLPDDRAFLQRVHERLVPGGRFYCTVPAGPGLWSSDDVYSGHFRRYRESALRQTLEQAGFSIEFCTHLFGWLTVPVFMCRVLPSRLGLRKPTQLGSVAAVRSDHRAPSALSGLVTRFHRQELRQIAARRSITHGTSLLCVAKSNANPSSPGTSL